MYLVLSRQRITGTWLVSFDMGRLLFNLLYWDFLLDHERTLRSNPRLGRNVLGLRYLDDDERRVVHHQAADFVERLEVGEG
jgi:deoxyribodipyrimidine photolyase-like uncharacterized protein